MFRKFDSWNIQKMNGCSFHRCHNTGKRFSWEASFENQQKEHRFFWKMVLRFLKQPSFERSEYFMWQSLNIFKVFNILTFEQSFWKTKTFLKKLECLFLVESTKIEITTFPYKTVLSEANVKRKRMGNTKCTYHRELSYASNYLFENFVLV